MNNHKPAIWKPNVSERKNVFINRIKLRRDDFHFHCFHENRVTERHTNTKRNASSVSGNQLHANSH